MDAVRVGLVGYKFMGKAHSNAYNTAPKFFDCPVSPVMKALCGRDEAGVKAAAENYGWESYETDWRKLIERDDIDLIDISAPSIVHRDIAVAAAEAGKHIFCEKPLAFTAAEGAEMLAAVEKAGVRHMMGFNYRRVPALALAKRLIDEGAVGRVFHLRATYLQDWLVDPEFPMNWRLRKAVAGSGSHGDLNAHLIDTARFLVGDIKKVVGMSETFIKERPAEGTSDGLTATAGEGTEKVELDDATLFLARMEGGAVASFEATRFATGRKNHNRIEINGSEGSIVFCFEQMNELQLFSRNDPDHSQGFRTIIATEGGHPYMTAWWPPGHIIGYEHTFVHEVYDLLCSIAHESDCSPDFRDGLAVQRTLEAVDKSIDKGAWVDVPKDK